MTAFVTVKSAFDRNGEADATMSDPGLAGADIRSHLPVRIKHLSERLLSVDGTPHEIISCVDLHGTTTYVIEGSTFALREKARLSAEPRAVLEGDCDHDA